MMNIDFHLSTPEKQRKQIRYQMRNEIETIIKEKHIDRNLFHEVSKFSYAQIFRKFYYTFCTHDKSDNCTVNPELMQSYMWLRFRNNLTNAELYRVGNWKDAMHHLYDMIPEHDDSMFYYLITDGGWLYEGTLPAVIEILLEYPPDMEDFYLFPKHYEYVVAYCDDGECMTKLFAKSIKGDTVLC